MANVADAPTFGLASTDDDGRNAALEFAKKALAAVKRWYVYTYLNRGFLYCMCLVACVLCVNICIKYFLFHFVDLAQTKTQSMGAAAATATVSAAAAAAKEDVSRFSACISFYVFFFFKLHRACNGCDVSIMYSSSYNCCTHLKTFHCLKGMHDLTTAWIKARLAK